MRLCLFWIASSTKDYWMVLVVINIMSIAFRCIICTFFGYQMIDYEFLIQPTYHLNMFSDLNRFHYEGRRFD
jgi:hypothetical protein